MQEHCGNDILSERQFGWAVFFAVAFVCFAAYVNTLEGDWVWDDASSVLLHKHVQNPGQFLSEDNWGSHFYLNINLPTRSYLGITIQPYYFVNWNSINLSKLSERLLNTAITTNSLGKFNQIGVSLIFNNGPQKNY